MPTIGTCSKCNGPVQVPELWGGSVPTIPTCARCGATAKEPYGPVVPMERKREVVRQAIERMKELPSSGGPFVFDEKLSAILSELRPNTCYATDRRITPQPNAASSAEETE